MKLFNKTQSLFEDFFDDETLDTDEINDNSLDNKNEEKNINNFQFVLKMQLAHHVNSKISSMINEYLPALVKCLNQMFKYTIAIDSFYIDSEELKSQLNETIDKIINLKIYFNISRKLMPSITCISLFKLFYAIINRHKFGGLKMMMKYNYLYVDRNYEANVNYELASPTLQQINLTYYDIEDSLKNGRIDKSVFKLMEFLTGFQPVQYIDALYKQFKFKLDYLPVILDNAATNSSDKNSVAVAYKKELDFQKTKRLINNILTFESSSLSNIPLFELNLFNYSLNHTYGTDKFSSSYNFLKGYLKLTNDYLDVIKDVRFAINCTLYSHFLAVYSKTHCGVAQGITAAPYRSSA